MPSTFRIPKAPITGLYGRFLSAYARRTYGQVPDGAYVYFHHKPLLKAVLSFEGKVAKWRELDPTLKSYAQLASAGVPVFLADRGWDEPLFAAACALPFAALMLDTADKASGSLFDCVGKDRLQRFVRQARQAGDVVAANSVLNDALETDVRPFLAEVRERLGVADDPLRRYRESGEQERRNRERVGTPAGSPMGLTGSGLLVTLCPRTSGSVSRKQAPLPGSPHASSRPWCRRASSMLMARPRPVPPERRTRDGSARQNRLNTSFSSPGRRPTP